jgi:hypothetical protein
VPARLRIAVVTAVLAQKAKEGYSSAQALKQVKGKPMETYDLCIRALLNAGAEIATARTLSGKQLNDLIDVRQRWSVPVRARRTASRGVNHPRSFRYRLCHDVAVVNKDTKAKQQRHLDAIVHGGRSEDDAKARDKAELELAREIEILAKRRDDFFLSKETQSVIDHQYNVHVRARRARAPSASRDRPPAHAQIKRRHFMKFIRYVVFLVSLTCLGIGQVSAVQRGSRAACRWVTVIHTPARSQRRTTRLRSSCGRTLWTLWCGARTTLSECRCERPGPRARCAAGAARHDVGRSKRLLGLHGRVGALSRFGARPALRPRTRSVFGPVVYANESVYLASSPTVASRMTVRRRSRRWA